MLYYNYRIKRGHRSGAELAPESEIIMSTTINFKEMYDFAISQIAFYENMVDYDNRDIEFYNWQLKRSREEDRKMVAYVWGRGVVTEWEFNFYNKNYAGSETKYNINRRAKAYRSRKHHASMIEKYKKEAAYFGKYVQ